MAVKRNDLYYGLINGDNVLLGFWIDKKALIDYIEERELEDCVVLTVTEVEIAVLPDPIVELQEMNQKQILDMADGG